MRNMDVGVDENIWKSIRCKGVSVPEKVLVDENIRQSMRSEGVNINDEVLVDVQVDFVGKQSDHVDEEVLVEPTLDELDRQEKEDKIDELDPHEIYYESEHEYSLHTDDNDPAWGGSNISSSEKDFDDIDEEDFEIENNLEGNPSSEDSGGSSNGILRKAKRPPSND